MIVDGTPHRPGRDASSPSGEATLDQLLAEPIVQLLMHRDGTNAESIRQLLRETAAARRCGLSIRGFPRTAGGSTGSMVRPDPPPLTVREDPGWRAHVAHRFRKLAAIALAVLPAICCAWLANQSGRWDLFERAGSIATTIGLIFASGRYIRHSVLDLVVTRSEEHDPKPAELFDEVLGTKIGLALSGFGTLVWGWGAYLRWWSLLYLALWGLFAACKIHRDNHRLNRLDAA